MNDDEIRYQITSVDMNHGSLDSTNELCQHLRNCPVADGIYILCTDCIGSLPLSNLKLIEPELTNENILKTIQIHEVLIK